MGTSGDFPCHVKALTRKLWVGGWIHSISTVSASLPLWLHITTSNSVVWKSPRSTFPQSTKRLGRHNPHCSGIFPKTYAIVSKMFPLTTTSGIWDFDLEKGSRSYLFDPLHFPFFGETFVLSLPVWQDLPSFEGRILPFLPLRTSYLRHFLFLNYWFNGQEVSGQHSLRKIKNISV